VEIAIDEQAGAAALDKQLPRVPGGSLAEPRQDMQLKLQRRDDNCEQIQETIVADTHDQSSRQSALRNVALQIGERGFGQRFIVARGFPAQSGQVQSALAPLAIIRMRLECLPPPV